MSDRLKGITGFQEQETVGVSPWMLALLEELGEESQAPHWSYSFDEFSVEVIEGKQSLWITTRFPTGGRVAWRATRGFGSILKGGYEDWEYIVSTNLLGYMAMTHEAIERMKSQKQGHIVNIGSMSADVREKDSSVYVATKSGIQGFSEALRKEANPLGIEVTLIEPGTVGTDMQSQYSPQEQRQRIEEMKMLRAEDIAACMLYTLTQPRRCDVVSLQIRPHRQSI